MIEWWGAYLSGAIVLDVAIVVAVAVGAWLRRRRRRGGT